MKKITRTIAMFLLVSLCFATAALFMACNNNDNDVNDDGWTTMKITGYLGSTVEIIYEGGIYEIHASQNDTIKFRDEPDGFVSVRRVDYSGNITMAAKLPRPYILNVN